MHAMEPAAASVEDLELLRAHTDAYPRDAKAAFLRLAELWAELELSPKEQLSGVIADAAAVWSGAVAAAEAAQQQLRQSIQDSLAEVAGIKAALGADDAGADANEPQVRQHGSRRGRVRTTPVRPTAGRQCTCTAVVCLPGTAVRPPHAACLAAGRGCQGRLLAAGQAAA